MASSTPVATRPDAAEINAHLAEGGIVQVTTYGRSVLYRRRNTGAFVELSDGCLGVRRGRQVDCLSLGQRMLVGLRFGKEV